jgi:hypothetical protein
LVATIDLKAEKPFNLIQTQFLLDPRHYIFLPTEVVLETSIDGINFKNVGNQTIAPADEDYNASIKKVSFNLPNYTAMYIRLTAICPSQLPQWRINSRKKPAICCDEVSVF